MHQDVSLKFCSSTETANVSVRPVYETVAIQIQVVIRMDSFNAVCPRYVQEVEQTHTLLELVREQIGVGVVPASATEFNPTGVVFRPLRRSGTNAVACAEMYAAWRGQRQAGNAGVCGKSRSYAREDG